MNCTNMIGLSLSISDDVFLYLPENDLLFKTLFFLISTSSHEIVVWFYGEGIRRPVNLTHEDRLGFTSLGPLPPIIITLHAKSSRGREEKSTIAYR